jgi:hypothetical protein
MFQEVSPLFSCPGFISARAPGAAGLEALPGDARIASLAIREQIEIGSDDLLEEFGAVVVGKNASRSLQGSDVAK